MPITDPRRPAGPTSAPPATTIAERRVPTIVTRLFYACGSGLLCLVLLLILVTISVFPVRSAQTVPTHGEHPGMPDGCQLPKVAFCDTFDVAAPGGRGGDLDERKWSVSRISPAVDLYRGKLNEWRASTHNHCGTRMIVRGNNDFTICNGHFMESLHDNGAYVWNSARIRQPFDFAARTGTIVMDVDAKAARHAWNIAVWIADEPVPGAYVGGAGTNPIPRNGIGFHFINCSGGFENDNKGRIQRVFVVKNYRQVYSIASSPDQFEGTRQLHTGECFTTRDNTRNHIEIRLSERAFEVWATDAGSTTLKRIAWADTSADDFEIPLSRGYVSFQHVGYNAVKFGNVPESTYHWDNLGFDGPVLPMDRGYDVPDALTPGKNTGAVNLGYRLAKSGISKCCRTTGWPDVPHFAFDDVNVSGAVQARLNLNITGFVRGTALGYRVNNGVWRTFPHPFPDSDEDLRAVSIPVPLPDLRDGANTLELKSLADNEHMISSIELELSSLPTDHHRMLAAFFPTVER